MEDLALPFVSCYLLCWQISVLSQVHCTTLYCGDDCDSDVERCLLTAADVTRRQNRIMFVGDSRVRELFHALLVDVTGTPRKYRRTHSSQSVTIDRLRLRAVRTRSPAVAEGPREAGVPVEMSMSIVDL